MNQLTQLAKSLPPKKIIDIVTKLGANRYQETNDAIIFPTICHHKNSEDAKMKLYYYPSTCSFHCYTDCGCSFNIYDLFKKRYELFGQDYNFFKDIVLQIDTGDYIGDKYVELANYYESIYNSHNYNAEVNYKKLNKGILNIYDKAYTSEWINDNISIEAMKVFNIRYSSLENKIIIPHYDINNNLIGVRGRTLNPEELEFGKYLPIKLGNKTLSHALSYNLYGLNLNKNNIRAAKFAIVSEGEKSVLQFETMYGRDKNIVVAACGSSFHKYQLNLLLNLGVEKVLIGFDKTGKTNKEREQYFCKLKSLCNKYKNYCSMGFIYDFDNLLKNTQSPFDCNKETFEKLLKKTVWI